jgi:hypothetical protein
MNWVDDVEKFRVVFKAFLALVVVAFAGTFLTLVAFKPADQLNEHTGVIVGFVTGTAFASVLGFYFGSSDRAKIGKEAPDA